MDFRSLDGWNGSNTIRLHEVDDSVNLYNLKTSEF